MGMKHREPLWQIPPGLVTDDEHLVLLVLADQTPDFNKDQVTSRYEYAHDRAVLLRRLRRDPERDADRKWLQRRLSDLDAAGLITRKPQKRLKGGLWARQTIRLNFSDTSWESFTPTKRAAKQSDYQENHHWSGGQDEKSAELVALKSARPVLEDGSVSLDELKQTLVDLCGEPTTESSWSHYNRVAAMVRDRGETSEKIRYVAGRLVEEWGSKTVTVASIEKHFTRYDAEVGQVTDTDVDRHKREREREERRRKILEAGA